MKNILNENDIRSSVFGRVSAGRLKYYQQIKWTHKYYLYYQQLFERVDFCFKIVSLLHCVSDLAYWCLHMLCPGFSVVKSGYRGFAIMQIWTIANSRLNDGE